MCLHFNIYQSVHHTILICRVSLIAMPCTRSRASSIAASVLCSQPELHSIVHFNCSMTIAIWPKHFILPVAFQIQKIAIQESIFDEYCFGKSMGTQMKKVCHYLPRIEILLNVNKIQVCQDIGT